MEKSVSKMLNTTAVEIPQSGIRVIKDMSDGLSDVIHLEIGQPDFSVSPHVIVAAQEAQGLGYSGYCANIGLEGPRQAFCARMKCDHSIDISAEQVTTTVGANGGLFNIFAAVVERGDEVLVPDPGYPNYSSAIALLGGVVVPYPLAISDNDMFFLDIDAMEKRITPKTKAIILNSPSNPTGWVATSEEIKEIVALVAKYGVYLISDEAYDHFVYTEGGHVSPLQYTMDDHIIGVYSCSKTYAMPGWRVGFTVSSPDLAKLFAKLQETYCGNTSTISQKAAEAALSGPQDCVTVMQKAYADRLQATMQCCDALGIEFRKPSGAFYMLLKVPSDVQRISSQLHAQKLVTETGVAVAPGSAFGMRGEEYLRISLCKDAATIEEGLYRMNTYFQNHPLKG
ncbi:MAG: pyridoxal phosphate-dependent aminotransferase [Sphaerochaetaceae bacterium]